MWEQIDLLITVKTYPHPSNRYTETVCTGGITHDGRWLRLYPVPFRLLSDDQRYRQYQWISLDARKRTNDFRPESYRPNVDTIRPGGHIPPTADGWKRRAELILPRVEESMEDLIGKYRESRVSMGLVSVTDVDKVIADPFDISKQRDYLARMRQLRLFGEEPVPMPKPIPWRFKFHYRCAGKACPGHTQTLSDWGINLLYLKQVQKHRCEEAAVEDVKAKMWQWVDSSRRDIFFNVGSVFPYETFLVGNVFAPPRSAACQIAPPQLGLDL